MAQEAHTAAEGLPQLHWGPSQTASSTEQSTEATGAVLMPLPPQLCAPVTSLTPTPGLPLSVVCLFMELNQLEAAHLCLVLSAGLTSQAGSAGTMGVL